MKKFARREFIKLTILGVPTLMACAKNNTSTLGAKLTQDTSSEALGNFSFIQVSDTHVDPTFIMPESLEGLRSYATVKTLPTLGSLEIEGDSLGTLEPEFLIHTGDMGEFGFAGVTQELVDRYFEAYTKPKYWIMGNHDNTWVANTKRFHDEFGGVSYSFDRNGVRFIGLNSATFQEPLPSFGEETILFLRETLKNTSSQMPIILFWHHPFYGDYFASDYDRDRVLDELREHHVIVVLNGHSHRPSYQDMGGGIDSCVATATFSREEDRVDGFSIVDIQNGRLRVVDVRVPEGNKTNVLLEKDIRTPVEFPKIVFEAPAFREVLKENLLTAKAKIALKKAPKAQYFLNGEPINSTHDGINEANGSQWLQVKYQTEAGTLFKRSTAFQWERPHRYSPQAKWTAELGAASVSTPLYHDGMVAIGDNNGAFSIFKAKNGKRLFQTKSTTEILRQAAVYNGDFFFGSGSGDVVRVNPKTFSVQELPIETNAVYCLLVIADGILYYGNQSAELVAFDLEKNQVAWINKDAQFSIESRPVVMGNEVFFTAWDGYLYSINRETGTLNWRTPGPKNLERERTGGTTSRYYAPADVSPIVTADRIYLCDRGYKAAIYDRNGAYLQDLADDVAAMSLSTDGTAIYLRRGKGVFKAVDLLGNTIWESNIVLGRFPIEPTVIGDQVLATNHTGTLYSFSTTTGAALWTYRITPQLFVLGRVEVDPEGETAFAVGMDGVLKAIDLKSLDESS